MEMLFREPDRTPRWRKAHIAECILIVAGLICVTAFVWSVVDTKVYQSYENYRLDAHLRGDRASITGYLRYLISDEKDSPPQPVEKGREAETRPPQKAPRAPMQRGSTIGRIEIPRINVSAVVREGADDKTLKKAAGHVPYTPLPGEHGNVGIAAHRDSFFRNLRNVREGDTIRVTTTWGIYEYEVDSLKIVKPENVEVLHPTPNPAITLVTCYPFNYVGSAPKRFIVRARQVSPAVELTDRSTALNRPAVGTLPGL